MLVPVIGLVQVGLQAHADRYTYLPQIGIYILVTWGVAELFAATEVVSTHPWRPRHRCYRDAHDCRLAADRLLVWSGAILGAHPRGDENNDVAERGIGTALLKVGRIEEAIAHDRAALRIHPARSSGLTNLANALLQNKELPEAIEHYREVVRLSPNDSELRCNLAKALAQNGATAGSNRAVSRSSPNSA